MKQTGNCVFGLRGEKLPGRQFFEIPSSAKIATASESSAANMHVPVLSAHEQLRAFFLHRESRIFWDSRIITQVYLGGNFMIF